MKRYEGGEITKDLLSSSSPLYDTGNNLNDTYCRPKGQEASSYARSIHKNIRGVRKKDQRCTPDKLRTSTGHGKNYLDVLEIICDTENVIYKNLIKLEKKCLSSKQSQFIHSINSLRKKFIEYDMDLTDKSLNILLTDLYLVYSAVSNYELLVDGSFCIDKKDHYDMVKNVSYLHRKTKEFKDRQFKI